jgi:hypothetical protein
MVGPISVLSIANVQWSDRGCRPSLNGLHHRACVRGLTLRTQRIPFRVEATTVTLLGDTDRSDLVQSSPGEWSGLLVRSRTPPPIACICMSYCVVRACVSVVSVQRGQTTTAGRSQGLCPFLLLLHVLPTFSNVINRPRTKITCSYSIRIGLLNHNIFSLILISLINKYISQ